MGRLAVERLESRALVADWKKQPGMLGMRFAFRAAKDRGPFEDLPKVCAFWGTDLTRMPCSYRKCVNLFTQELPWLEGDDLEWVIGRGVCEWLAVICHRSGITEPACPVLDHRPGVCDF